MDTGTASSREYDAVLFGRDRTLRVVAVQPQLDAAPASVEVYRRPAGETEVTSRSERFYPFFFLSDVALLRGFARDRFRFQELEGSNFYRYLIVLDTWDDYWGAIRHVEKGPKTPEGAPAPLHLISSAAQQYLIQSGMTLFKGMAFDEVHRLQLDIETYSPSGFPRAARLNDRVIIVALSDNRGWKRLLHLRPDLEMEHGVGFSTEQEMLAALVREIGERDPDVIEGHNIYAYDFPYLRKRCKLHGVAFGIGRDGSEPRSFSTSMRFAERTVEFPALEIAGRHVVDTYFLVMSYDVFKRDLPGYGLKAAARYFGFAPEGRTYVRGGDISSVWREDPERLLAYALDDVIETERLGRHLSGSTFYLTQMVPMLYGHVARIGPAAKIEALFVREYLRRRRSLPAAEWGSQTLGGYTDIFVSGVVGPIVYADVESLYPSVMLHFDVRPERDTLGLFQTLLRRLTDMRLEAKKSMADAGTDEERGELDARQSSYKVLINSFYGLLGFSQALFNDYSEADRVAATGQKILRRIIAAIREESGLVIEVDTDGVLFVPPSDVRGEEAERAFLRRIGRHMPQGIRIGFDGRYQKMLSYKRKNYALLTYGGEIRFKGSSLVSRANERFGRQFVRDAVRLLMEEDVEGLHDLYLTTRDMIMQHDWPRGAESFSRTETIKDNVENYLSDVEAGRRPRAAAYELAIARSRRTGRPVRKGDRVSYYVTGNSANTTAADHSRLASEWSQEAPDENTPYYLRRLDEFARKFETFFDEYDFRLVFSPEDLFGFNAEGIELQVRHRSVPSDEEVPF